MEIIKLTEEDMERLFTEMYNRIRKKFPFEGRIQDYQIYGVPRGGIPVAYRLAGELGFSLTENPEMADIVVDDIVCTGKTRERVVKEADSNVLFESLIDLRGKESFAWYIFPWEQSITGSADDIPIRLLEFIGEDPLRDGLRDTPRRFLEAWQFFTQGYKQDVREILGTVFENEEKYDEMVVLRDIEFYSMCEHHMIPFFGKVHIAYIPRDKVVGISKLARLIECFSRRLQVQERLTEQIANAIVGNLDPIGVAVLVEAKHLCMVARGVQKQNSVMVTSSLKGSLEEQAARMEFLLLKG